MFKTPFTSYNEAIASYDRQIAALLASNFAGYSTECSPNEHSSMIHAWGNASGYVRSLFGTLPGCTLCASEIEFYDPWANTRTETERRTRAILLAEATCSLPDSTQDRRDFTPMELEEFKRRQLQARFPKEYAEKWPGILTADLV